MAAASSIVKNSISGEITITNGAASTLTLAFDMGDLSIDNLRAKQNETVKFECRGKHKGQAYGNRVYPTISFTAYATNFVGSSTSAPGSMLEILTSTGAYAAGGSTLGTGQPVAVDITLTIEGTDVTDPDDETITISDVDCTISFAEGVEGNKFSISGEVLGTIVADNGTNAVTFTEIS